MTVPLPWSLECSSCGTTRSADGLPGVCDCGHPYLVRYSCVPPPAVKSQLAGRPWTMWRYREWLPLGDGESPVTLGEGGTPLLAVQRIAAQYGFEDLRSEEHTSELQSRPHLVCRLLPETQIQ